MKKSVAVNINLLSSFCKIFNEEKLKNQKKINLS